MFGSQLGIGAFVCTKFFLRLVLSHFRMWLEVTRREECALLRPLHYNRERNLGLVMNENLEAYS